MPRIAAFLCLAAVLGGCVSIPKDRAMLERQVADTERDFARTMQERNHAAFVSFLSEEVVFFSPAPLRGRQAVGDAWKRFYEGPEAPFSWEPTEVQVLDSGTLALTSGPVHDPRGRKVGTFTSIWRLEDDGWRIIFDKGCDVCAEKKK